MLNQKEQLSRYVDHGLEDSMKQSSPMDPPEPYELPVKQEIAEEAYAEPIRILLTEHHEFLNVLADFEIALLGFKENGFKITSEISKNFKQYFEFMDTKTLEHNRKEEKALFPILRRYLIEAGECSPGMNPTTPTDVMEGDHMQVSHATYLIFNLLGLASRLVDSHSKHMVYQTVYEQGREIVEVMKLHIYKENNVLFPLAHKYLTDADYSLICKEMGLNQVFDI